MNGGTTSGWDTPVEFYFLVDFQNMNGQTFRASFSEVSGIGWDLSTVQQDTGTNGKMPVPAGFSHPRLVLKRPLAPLDEEFASWVSNCMKMMFLSGADSGVRNRKVCDVVVKLLDKGGQPLAAWSCNHAFPLKYTLGGLNAEHSGLAFETVELEYNRLERLK